MRRKGFFVLICIVLWVGMLIRTFFWWNWTNNPNIQDSGTWFIDVLTNTWNNDWIQINTWNTTKEWNNEIRVMMPRYFYNSGWEEFKNDLYKDEKVQITFTFIDDLNSYRDQLFNNFSWADLFLFPYDWNENVSRIPFSPQDDLELMFDFVISPITQNNQAWFLPFAADPMIMYTLTWFSWANSFYNISEYTFNRESIKPMSFPLFFGIDIEDIKDTWFKREYQDIVRYALMHYFETNNDSHDLQTRIDSNVLQKYNIQDLNTIINAISAPECKYFPSICFQLYGFVWIRFWFLSDIDIAKQYFSWRESKFENLSKFSMPFYQLESPTRIRWRWISNYIENTDIINWINEFLIKYMNEYDKYNLRNSTLPLFKSEDWKWLIDNEYIWLRWYILQSWWDYTNTLKSKNNFQNLIEYKINAKEYLRW